MAASSAPPRPISCATARRARRRTSPSHNCILFDQPEYLNHWPFRAADGTVERLRVRGNFRSDNGDALYELLLGGLGIAHAADFLALPHLATGRLVPLLPEHAVDERTAIHAVYPQRRHLPAKVRAFIDFLVERLQPGTRRASAARRRRCCRLSRREGAVGSFVPTANSFVYFGRTPPGGGCMAPAATGVGSFMPEGISFVHRIAVGSFVPAAGGRIRRR